MRPLRADGLDRVAPEVEQRLYHLVAVEPQARQARVVVALDRHARRRFGREQVTDVLDELVNVDRFLAWRLAGTEQRVHQRREPVRLADDDGRVLVQRRVLQLALEQLGGTAQPTERVLDLVRELPDHRAASAELGEQRVLAQDALVLRDVRQLDDHAAGPSGLVERGDGHVEHARRSAGACLERQFAA